MNREELLDRLSQDILAYVMHGEFPEHHFAQEIAPAELDERFHDYEMLVRLHFILRPDVVEFVETLPQHLRSIKTQTATVSNVRRGTVEGRINWAATTRERHSKNPEDHSIFVCDNRTENYDIDENIVLRRLLGMIFETLREAEQYLEQDYAWVNDRWKGESDLVDEMRDIFRRNVHLTRIREPDEYEPTERMLQRAHESRQEVYRDAAELLSRYRETLSGDPGAIRELLDQTAITPDDDETLFELFVLFRYVSVIEGMANDRFTISTIERGSQEVARLESDGRSVVLYHDSAARAEDLEFISDIKDKHVEALSRTEKIKYEKRRLAGQYFPDAEVKYRTGRPDVIVLQITSGDREEYLITEVKYSSGQETVERGIEELLEYLAFLRDDGDLVFEEPDIFGSGWNGLLAIRDVKEQETDGLEDQEPIQILQASELETNLEKILEHTIETDLDQRSLNS